MTLTEHLWGLSSPGQNPITIRKAVPLPKSAPHALNRVLRRQYEAVQEDFANHLVAIKILVDS